MDLGLKAHFTSVPPSRSTTFGSRPVPSGLCLKRSSDRGTVVRVRASGKFLEREYSRFALGLFKELTSLPATGESSAFPAMTIITFDVDGTLITSTGSNANKLHKLAFAHALKQVFDVDTNIDVIKHHGMTDPLILLAVLEHHGVSKDKGMEKLQNLEDEMNKFFESHRGSAGAGLVLLPGVHQLLSALKQREGVQTGLVTGNLQPIGRGKMEALGILSLFTKPHFGGFGSDYCSGNTVESWRDRGEMVKIAIKRAQGAVASPDSGGRFHVGDTPMDLLAAQEGGAKAVGVLTGIYSRDELLQTGVDAIILEDLSNLEATLSAFGLSPQ